MIEPTALILGAAILLAVVFWRPLSNAIDRFLEKMDTLLARWRSHRFKDTPTAIVLLLPAMGVIALFGFLPLLLSLYLSLFGGMGINMRFVGLDNYREALDHPAFWNSLAVTVYFALGTIPITLVLSYLIASFLFRIGRGRGFFRTVYFLPHVTSVVAAATVWRVLLHPQIGPINNLLGALGLPPSEWPRWLLEPRGVLHLISGGWIPEGVGPSLALCCVILFEIWHGSGFMIVILLAGLAAIPPELEEAATIDGAGWLQRTRHITIPMLSPTLFFLLIVSSIKSFQAFNSFYALTGTGRGPYNTTMNMTVYIFASLYERQRIGYGAALATLLAVAIIALTVVQWRFLGRKVHYE